ncbi:MAG: nucleotidyl transferase AbiEii/AbiGii toxin family protein [Parcubacteria group bacterium]|nr:nucleotidyl transferase AbiEii/AbiGii toxin family protein [Parcubacteria group bacterium]
MIKSVLTETQIAILKEIGQSDFLSENFYLTGGTALAGFYLHHRYSEDLDFFSEKEFDIAQLDVVLKRIKEKLAISKIDYQQSYNRNLFFLHLGGEILKTEFTYFPFPRIEQGKEEYGVFVDSLLDIATNKLFSIFQRTHARDYIDLYSIVKEKGYVIDELVKKAKLKFDWHIDPLQLGTQFVKSQEVEDFPRMITEIHPEEWRAFFLEEAKKLRDDIVQ